MDQRPVEILDMILNNIHDVTLTCCLRVNKEWYLTASRYYNRLFVDKLYLYAIDAGYDNIIEWMFKASIPICKRACRKLILLLPNDDMMCKLMCAARTGCYYVNKKPTTGVNSQYDWMVGLIDKAAAYGSIESLNYLLKFNFLRPGFNTYWNILARCDQDLIDWMLSKNFVAYSMRRRQMMRLSSVQLLCIYMSINYIKNITDNYAEHHEFCIPNMQFDHDLIFRDISFSKEIEAKIWQTNMSIKYKKNLEAYVKSRGLKIDSLDDIDW